MLGNKEQDQFNLIKQYFEGLMTPVQEKQIELLPGLYREWNEQINVISRKDMDDFLIHHVLHSMALRKFMKFEAGTKCLDAGTGGGFPGIPLAILNPDCHFTLVDARRKKIKVVEAVVESLGLQNVKAQHARLEDLEQKFHLITGRAVTNMGAFYRLVAPLFESKNRSRTQRNGLIYWKGTDYLKEVSDVGLKCDIYKLSAIFKEPYFDEKFILYFFRRTK